MNSNNRSPHKNEILIFNAGSSSIKFAIYNFEDPSISNLKGEIERVGLPGSIFHLKDIRSSHSFSKEIQAPTQKAAIDILIDFFEENRGQHSLCAIGHRVVHGGAKFGAPEKVSADLIRELRALVIFDPEHMPAEIMLLDEVHTHFSHIPQFVCFDTAFHHEMPRVAQIIPIPRKYESLGVRRYGFHGLSYSFIVGELARISGKEIANSRLIVAHLGSGASLAAIREGQSVETTMSFTPASGIPMGTRSGDLDPGLVSFLSANQNIGAKEFANIVNLQSGMLGISETSSDMRDLLKLEGSDPRAKDAIDVFCYQVKKSIGALTTTLGGLDTLVFTGGIGENAQVIRSRICENLNFLGIEIDPKANLSNENVISTSNSRVAVMLLRTNEELMIAKLIYEGNFLNSTTGVQK